MEKSQRRVADYPLHRLSNQPVFQTEIPPTASVQRTDRAKKKALLEPRSQTKNSKIYSDEKTRKYLFIHIRIRSSAVLCDVQGWVSPLRRPVVAWPVDSDRFRRAAWENHFALNPSYDSTFGRSDGWTCDVSAALSG